MINSIKKKNIPWKIGDFVKVSYENAISYCLYVTDIIFGEITGIIVEIPTFLSFTLFKKRKLFLKHNNKTIEKITDKQKIKELTLILNIHLLQKS